jgi:hypothetical protein
MENKAFEAAINALDEALQMPMANCLPRRSDEAAFRSSGRASGYYLSA